MKMELDGTHVNEVDLESDPLPVEPPNIGRLAPYRKAVVAVVTVVAVAGTLLGVDVDESLADALTTLVTAIGALLVWRIPNAPQLGSPAEEVAALGRDDRLDPNGG